ncbi:endonuclease/exonuclease/phosphatase family protein [Chitinophaga sp. sic0106]|uniref:endonuclease/exonuclease/phosphatase family protein n=1 Tax=Chitinophaga sp. sic0106 TaxID=2854785 RepID=UPI001C469FEF|nr:endonuclease/exonuclease/phosphatase family protein [Chitinophaga sp. sic0106]MBV7531151.1 endonuclease/exonuclease/phosphatase family protein [Chitinophaga sp. sic0106]
MKRVFIAALLLSLISSAGISQHKIKVLSYNIHHAANMKNVIDLPAIAAVINAEMPDLVALQEVDSATGRSGKIDQLKELAKLTGMHCYFGRSMKYDGGGYGTGILSRYPIKEATTLQMPVGEGKEPRASGIIVAQIPGTKGVRFASTHLDVEDEDTWRIQEAELLSNHFSKSKLPVIIAGDFNALPDSKPIATFKKLFTDISADSGPSFPSEKPRIKLDYIMTAKAPASWKATQIKVINEPMASDHRPVFAEISF